jgi:hypothetical protein
MIYASVSTLPKSGIEYSQHDMKLARLTGDAIFHPVVRLSLFFRLLATTGRSSQKHSCYFVR